jgi:superfamily II DNA or RNA helicase
VHTVELRPFQRAIVEAAMRDEEGIARSPTGSGKTEALIGAMVEANLPSLIIVNEQGLLDQWVRRLRGGLGLRSDQVGVIGGGKREVRPVTVGMQQTLRNCVDEVAPYFGFVGCDEAHLFAAKTFLEVVDQFPARYRIGVTAEEKRADGKEYLLYDTIGPLIADVKQDKLVEEGFILEVEVRLVPTNFDRPWWQDLDPRARGLEQNRLLAEMGEDRDRNELVVELATRAARDEGQQVLVMAHHVDHCRRLLADIAARNPRCGLLIGGDSSADKGAYTKTLAGMMRGDVQIGVGTYAKMSTGIDIKSLARGVAATPVHLNRYKLKQIIGRYCRSAEGKTDAVLYVLWDRAIFGLAPVENFKRWAKRVSVWDGAWVDAREFLKTARAT